MNEDSSDAKKIAPYAISFGCPNRFIGTMSIRGFQASLGTLLSNRFVSIMPGQIELTRMFAGASSIATALVIPRTAHLLAMYEMTEIYHLAALLSTRAEFTPETAHEVNVGGTINLLRLAAEHGGD